MKNYSYILHIFKIIFLAALLWFVITSWDTVIDRLLFDILKIDPYNTWSYVLVAIINTIIAVSIFLWLDVNFIDTFGIQFNEQKS